MDTFLDAALEIDPDFADAWNWKTFANWARQEASEISPEDYALRHSELQKRLAAINPGHVGILFDRAWAKTVVDTDFAAAAPIWKQVYLAAPNDAERVRFVAHFATYIGRADTATALLKRAIAVDPLCTRCLYHLSRNYMYAGQWEEALESRERYLLIGEESGHYYHGIIKLMLGDAEGALEIFQGFPMNPELTLAGKAMAFEALGQRIESDAALSSLIDEWGDEHPEVVAGVYATRHDNMAAFEWLDELLDIPPHPVNGSFRHISAAISPMLHNLHDDPRWEQFRMAVGMPTELLESLEFSFDQAQIVVE